MKYAAALALSIIFAQTATAEPAPTPVASLATQFRQPPSEAGLWVYWWWLNTNVDERSLTADLEAMKAQGVAGVLMFDARGYHDDYVPPPPERAEFMSPRWRQLVSHAVREAGRLGLQVSINLSSCAGTLKGPWNVGDDMPKKLDWATSDVQGPSRLTAPLPSKDWPKHWPIAVVAAQREADKSVSEVIDLASHVGANGQLDWQVPAGQWTVLRFVCVPMENREYDVDILDEKAVAGHFQRMGRAVLADAGPLAGKTVTHLYSVSWEGAIPSWTVGFEKHFRLYRGYDILPYLPALAGMALKTPEVTERFLRDYNRSLADCFANHFYGKLHKLSNEAGVQWHSESGGPWERKLVTFKHADQLAFLGRNDMPQGEFWYSHANHMLNRPIAMAAHIYGRRLAAVEAFTHMTYHWSAYPAALKPFGDVAFCDGANQFIWHIFDASPAEFGRPGLAYFAGTHFNPNTTWWRQSGPLVQYLNRCQFMLRQAQPVVDVCCYMGDKPYLHWGRAEKWSPNSALSLGKGYTYDLVNTEVLLQRLSVRDGLLTLPEGLQYRLLVLDPEDETIPPEALAKIAELAKAGATVVLGRKPSRAPGLKDYPACDRNITELANQLWSIGASDNRSFGQGKLLTTNKLDSLLAVEKALPDFVGPFDYTHRRDDNLDVYFIAGNGGQQAPCTFRVSGKEPELWDPVTGTIRDAVYWHATDDGRTVVPIAMPENGSMLVVFRKPAAPHVVACDATSDQLRFEGRNDGRPRVSIWQNGHFTLQTTGQPATIEVRDLPEPLGLGSGWNVKFNGFGAPESIAFPTLSPWNEHANEAIRHYAGTAVYSRKFALSPEQAQHRLQLALGEVQQLAEVKVNGKSLGIVWTAPWSIDISGAARAGQNTLEIAVTNTWTNRLIADADLPPNERLTKTNVPLRPGVRDPKQFRPFQGYFGGDRLMRSGLIGPVRIEFGRPHDLDLRP